MAEHTFLVLQDGTIFRGTGFGAAAPRAENLTPDGNVLPGTGELVFNTGMSGYHEILTDPSYTGQLVIMTSPHIGNYGDLEAWSENRGPAGAEGLIVRDGYRGIVPPGRMTLDAFLRRREVPGISGIDTRALTLHIREKGNLKGCLVRSAGGTALSDAELKSCSEYLEACPDMEGLNLVSALGKAGGESAAHDKSSAMEEAAALGKESAAAGEAAAPHFAVLDFGIKEGIVRELKKRGCRVSILPHNATAEAIRAVNPEAVLISNGPGDPAVLSEEIKVIAGLLGEYPLFGICLGHQLLSLALGVPTYKLKFGHHSLNQPVLDTGTGKIFITSQNHGFAVREPEGVNGLEVWMRNANDGTIEGIRHDKLKIRAVQFHPEAAPGPHDTLWIFDEFIHCTRERS